MIDFPFFRALGSISVIENFGSEIKAILLSDKGGILRRQARAIADQANKEASLIGIGHLFAAVVDRPFDDEIGIPFDQSNQLKGNIACRLSEDGIWEADDTKLISRRNGGPYLGVFVGPIDNRGVKACYQTLVDESYPTEKDPNPSLDLVAAAVLRLINFSVGSVALEIESLNKVPHVKKLHDVMDVLQRAYKSSGNADASWNVLWMLHVDKGIANLQTAISGYRGEELQLYIEEIIYPSFGLPNPADGIAYRAGHLVDKAVDVFWSSEDLIASSIEGIETSRSNGSAGNLRLAQIDWSDFDFTVQSRDGGGRGSSLLGFLIHSSSYETFIEALIDLSEEEFFNPSLGSTQYLELRNPDGSTLASKGLLSNIEIIEEVTFANVKSKRYLISSELLVLVPLVANRLKEFNLDASEISIEDLSPKNHDRIQAEVIGRSIWDDNYVAIRIRFSRFVRGSSDFSHIPKVRNLRIVVPVGDSMFGLVSRQCRLRVIMLPPNGVGAFVVGSGTSITPVAFGETEFDEDGIAIKESDRYVFTGTSNSEIKLLVWSIDEPDYISINGKVKELKQNSMIRHFEQFNLSSNQVIVEVDEVSLVIEPLPTNESNVSVYQSPLRAATEKGSVDSQVSDEDRNDLRGKIETLYFRNWNIWCKIGLNIGHIAVSATRNEDLSSVELDLQTRVLVSSEISGFQNLWPIRNTDKIENELLESEELLNFVKTFDDLQLIDAIDELGNMGGVQWISKVDLSKHLRRVSKSNTGKVNLVDNYLEAFTKLIQKADSVCGNFGKFWVRYPFSLSIWDENPKQLASVMLSPFHPLRFAWLANAEEVLNSSSIASVEVRRMFAGTISGWQFPMVTRSDTVSGAMMAVPTDIGMDSLFAGWSMLVSASVNIPTPLAVPRFAANGNVPGVSASGLDASAVESAVSDFHKANPFVSTLVIDLASSSESPRTSTIDSGLVSKISAWSNQRIAAGQSPGGVKVYDSVNRLGAIPNEVLEIADAEVEYPPAFTWRKYDPLNFTPSANVRIMSDSEVSVEIESGHQVPRHGVVSLNPLRRFEVSRVIEGQEISEIFPMINSIGTSRYIEALISVEDKSSINSNENSKIKFSINSDHAILSGADWTVLGESGLAPAALSALLQSSGSVNTKSTLWEWKPPFFDGGRSSSLSTVDRRPYLTIARIPNIYSQKLSGLVGKLLGEDVDDDERNKKISQVIRTIGSRGVGLSSLIGGKQANRTHQKGAIGFSMVFDLIDAVATNSEARFVIPLDAANKYLNVLANRPNSDKGKRADLLGIEIKDDRLVFVPIEIKFYRLESPVIRLPDKNDREVLAAKDQAVSSVSLLNDVKRFWSETRHSVGDKVLMDNAIVALIDAAVRLSPVNLVPIEVLQDRMQRLANGELEIEVGLPVVAYLVATSHETKARHASFPRPERCELLIADPRQVEIELRGGVESEIITYWRKILRSAFLSSQDKPGITGLIQEHGLSESTENSTAIVNDTHTELDAELAIVNEDSLDATFFEEGHGKSIEERENAQNERSPSVATAVVGSGLIEHPGVKLEVGSFVDANEDAYFWPGNTDLSSLNVGVLGDMGTGKTQLCLGLVNQLRRLSRKVQDSPMTGLILDYKRDYQKSEFLEAVGGIVLKPRNLPLDIFGIAGEKSVPEMNAKAMNFINIISMVFGGIGGQQRDRLREVIIEQISELDHSPTMQEVSEAYRLANKNKADSVTEILNNFVYGEIFSTNPNTFLNMDQLLAENVVVVDLRELDPDERTKKTLVAVFLSKYFEYMVKLPKWPVQPGKPQLRRLNSFLLVDEAVSIMEYHFEPLHQVLLQGREYGVSVVLSSQYLSHFISSEANYAQPLRTWFIHRVPTVSKKSLNELGIVSATNDDAAQIADLRIHHAFYASFDCPGRFIEGNPFFRQLEQMEVSERKW